MGRWLRWLFYAIPHAVERAVRWWVVPPPARPGYCARCRVTPVPPGQSECEDCQWSRAMK